MSLEGIHYADLQIQQIRQRLGIQHPIYQRWSKLLTSTVSVVQLDNRKITFTQSKEFDYLRKFQFLKSLKYINY